MQSDFTLRLDSPEHPHFHEGSDPEDWSITFAETGAEAQTGARVKRIEKYIQEDEFLMTYGDGVADIDVGRLLEFHRGHGKIATVTGVRTNSRYGELAVLDGRVKSFSEKPPADEAFISGGFFVFNRRLFDYLSDDDSCALERAPLEALTHEGQLMSYLHPGYWHSMDTYRDFMVLNELWRQGAPWKIWR
jgi:glucose-1-phosphate cytidylyltransferase